MPKRLANYHLRGVSFIKKFLLYLNDPNVILLVLDEMGIGTAPLRHYGYSHIGTPVVLRRKKKGLLDENLTSTVTISKYGTEFV